MADNHESSGFALSFFLSFFLFLLFLFFFFLFLTKGKLCSLRFALEKKKEEEKREKKKRRKKRKRKREKRGEKRLNAKYTSKPSRTEISKNRYRDEMVKNSRLSLQCNEYFVGTAARFPVLRSDWSTAMFVWGHTSAATAIAFSFVNYAAAFSYAARLNRLSWKCYCHFAVVATRQLVPQN